MFKILQKTFTTGIATVQYPEAAPVISEQFRGRPEFHFEAWQDARPAAAVCPTGAITIIEDETTRQVTVDYGGPALKSWMLYQFRATSIKNVGSAIATTEDLKGVFLYK